MALVLSGLGLLGIRIIFAHLLVVALVLFLLRRRMHESSMWERATERAPPSLAGVRALFSRAHIGPLLFLAGMYGIWNLKAGTSGFFFPYILRTVGAESQAQAVALQAVGFASGILGAYLRLHAARRPQQPAAAVRRPGSACRSPRCCCSRCSR